MDEVDSIVLIDMDTKEVLAGVKDWVQTDSLSDPNYFEKGNQENLKFWQRVIYAFRSIKSKIFR